MAQLDRLLAAAVLAACLIGHSLAIAQPPPVPPPQPIMPPSLPPSQVVDLMTTAGSALFGAQWKVMEAKIVEVPAAPNAMPQYRTTYNTTPRAGENGFDDSSWPVIDAKDLGARRGGGHVSFMW